MTSEKDKLVRPVPLLSVTGSFRPTGEAVASSGGVIRVDSLSLSVEGHVSFVRGGVTLPAWPGHHHMKRRRDKNAWDDLL